MHTLVTFIGRTDPDPDTGVYRNVWYRFPDDMTECTEFFGLKLIEWLNSDRVLILGTRGSMWERLIEHVVGQTEEESEARLTLMTEAPAENVTQDLLNRCEAIVGRGIGKPVRLRLIPYGRDEVEQQEILAVVADAVTKGKVSFDITHGFRHLAALGLLSSFFLKGAGRLGVNGIYYGALDMAKEHPDNPSEKVAPVIRLDGLLGIQAWIEAFARFDSSGDYGVFAPLLEVDLAEPHQSLCRSLTEAAFYERASNAKKARIKIGTFLPALEAVTSGPSALFKLQLEKRLAWARNGSLLQNQIALAHIYLMRRDMLRAALFGLEATVTRECHQRNYDEDNYENRNDGQFSGGRNQAKKWLNQDGPDAYKILNDLRNSLAHGTIPQRPEVPAILNDPENWNIRILQLFIDLDLPPPADTARAP